MSGEWSLVCWLANAVWKLTHWGLSGGPWYTPLSSGFNRGNDDQPWIFGALPIFRQSHICYIRIKWLRTCEKYPRGGKGQHQRGCPDTPGSHAIISKYETRNKAAWNSPCGNRGGGKGQHQRGCMDSCSPGRACKPMVFKDFKNKVFQTRQLLNVGFAP